LGQALPSTTEESSGLLRRSISTMQHWSTLWTHSRWDWNLWMGITMFWSPKEDRLHPTCHRFSTAQQSTQIKRVSIAHNRWNIQASSVIDLNTGYLSIPLYKDTQELNTIVTTFKFFECCVLPMGIRPATDIFQSNMASILQPMTQNKPNPYINDIFHGKGQDYDSHLNILGDIFTWLLEAGMQVNLSKSELCATQVESLGSYWNRLDANQHANESKQFSKSYHLAIARKYKGFLEQSILPRTTSQIGPTSWPPSHC
jgi:hypothetical protein